MQEESITQRTHHCLLHRLALAAKFLTANIKIGIEQATKLINFVKGSALNVRLLRKKAMDAKAGAINLLYYRGKFV